jgi:hypothetical protein
MLVLETAGWSVHSIASDPLVSGSDLEVHLTFSNYVDQREWNLLRKHSIQFQSQLAFSPFGSTTQLRPWPPP